MPARNSVCRTIIAAAAMLSVNISSARADNAQALKDRLHTAARQSTLRGESLQPFHLKMSIQLFDEKGKPGDRGTVEVFWAGGKEKRVYAFPSYSATEVRTGGKLFRTPSAAYPPVLAELTVKQVLDPMPDDSTIDGSEPQMQQIKFGKAPLDCIMLAKPIAGLKSVPMGLFPTYCFDPGKNVPRLGFNYGTQTVLRNQITIFQQKRYVAQDITVKQNDVDAAKAQVAELAIESVEDAQFATDGLQEISSDAPVKVASGVVAGHSLAQAAPIYPAAAKERHAEGVVVLHAIIGTDGHIRDLEVASSTDPDLAISAIAAVRGWVYKPYLLNGVPVSVETTINLNFALGL